ncbi:MAG: NAD(P)-dependent oxidoreductase [Rikenellaceae bacterium]
MRILLTGGSGFIGRNIMESYLVDKYEIHAPTSKELNVASQESVDDYFSRNKVDIVIHSAVKPSHRNAVDFNDILQTNATMFCNLERHNHHYQKMLVVGSGAIYDLRNYRPKMSEEQWREFVPADVHGFCKYMCEKIIEHSSNIYDLRVFGIFGKYEDYAIRFISNNICKSLYDRPMTIRQDRVFDYISVEDFVTILDLFIQHTPKHKSYNITPDKSIRLSELAQMVGEVSGNSHPIQIAESGLGLEYSGDNSRLMAEFPQLRFTPIRDSIERLYRWYEGQKAEGKLDEEVLKFDK